MQISTHIRRRGTGFVIVIPAAVVDAIALSRGVTREQLIGASITVEV